MSIERMVLAFAGSFILISIALSLIFSPYGLFFTAFVGANLLQSAFTGFCRLAKILKAVGETPGGEIFKYERVKKSLISPKQENSNLAPLLRR